MSSEICLQKKIISSLFVSALTENTSPLVHWMEQSWFVPSLSSPHMFIFLQIWEINTKYVRNAFKGHTHSIYTLDFSPNGRLLVSASDDNTIRLWNMHDGATKLLTEENPTFLDGPCYYSALFSPNGRYVAASHRDGMVRIWDVYTSQLTRRMKAHASWASYFAYTPDGKGLVSGGWDHKLRYWDVSSLDSTRFGTRSRTIRTSLRMDEQTWMPEREFVGHEVSWFIMIFMYSNGSPFILQDLVHSFASSPDGRWIVSGSNDRTVRIWDTRTAAEQCSFIHDKSIWTVDFSPVGCHLASAGKDGTLRIWKYSNVVSAEC